MFDWDNTIALHAMQGIGPHLVVRGKSHGFSRVAAGTWGIFSSYDQLFSKTHVVSVLVGKSILYFDFSLLSLLHGFIHATFPEV